MIIQMDHKLSEKKIAILVTDGFEQVEMTETRKALDEQGALTELISINPGVVKAWKHPEWGDVFTVDKTIVDVNASDYDALLLPGGVMNPDSLRMNRDAVAFIKKFFDEGKPVAAICHGAWTLIEAGVVKGRKMTSWPSIQTDLRNAGAIWEDSEVVVDNGLVTSRKPDDIPAFNKKMIEVFATYQNPQK